MGIDTRHEHGGGRMGTGVWDGIVGMGVWNGSTELEHGNVRMGVGVIIFPVVCCRQYFSKFI